MQQTINNKKINDQNRGMALLLSLIILSIVLTTSLGVYNILVNSIKLSGTTRESQLAFYAADSGIECALYWDLQQSAFATSTSTYYPPSNMNCSDSSDIASSWTLDRTPTSATTKFDINVPNNSCVNVTVYKRGVGQVTETTITAIGRNTCIVASRRVNRSIQVIY